MVKFLTVLGIGFVVISLAALLWPRFSPNPRPSALEKLHAFLLSTPAGQNAANVLGVSDDATVLPLTPSSISQQITDSVHSRISSVIITNFVRIISSRFKDLPIQDQEKVLNEFSKVFSQPQEATASPTQNLPNATK
jgi:hypothetical protein